MSMTDYLINSFTGGLQFVVNLLLVAAAVFVGWQIGRGIRFVWRRLFDHCARRYR